MLFEMKYTICNCDEMFSRYYDCVKISSMLKELKKFRSKYNIKIISIKLLSTNIIKVTENTE